MSRSGWWSINFILALLLGASALGTLRAPPPGLEPRMAPRAPAAPGGGSERLFLPVIRRVGTCGGAAATAFGTLPVSQWDTDNPVRYAHDHADKNLALRGYAHNPSAGLSFISAPNDDDLAPQLATLFVPPRVPGFTNGYRVYDWVWAPSPNPGQRGALNDDWDMTVLGMQVAPGEPLVTPQSGYDIGGGMEVIVLFADEDSVALHYTSEDTAALGYTIHIDNICTDPGLLALYNQLDAPNGPRYKLYPGTPSYNTPDYFLPALAAGQAFGYARSTEIRVAIVDTGSFMHPLYCNAWWRIRPGRSCP